MADDPWARAKLIVTYVVLGVWVIVLVAGTFFGPSDSLILGSVQAIMMAVVGGLFVDRLIKKNGRDAGK